MKTYYLLRIATWLSRLVPIRTAYWICSLIGGIVFYLNPRIRDAVLDNLGHVLPNASKRQRRNIARKVIRNTVKNYYDLVRLPHMDKKEVEHRVTVYGVEHFSGAFEAGKGVIFFGGHLGNWNLVPQMAAALGYNVNIVAEDIEPPKLYDYVNKLRSRFGLKLIKLGSAEIRTLYKLLKNGEGLALAADRDVTDNGIPVQFFDAPADLPPGAVVLAVRLNVPLVPVLALRLPNSASVVHVYPPMELERTGDRDRDVQINLRKMAQVLEEMILKAPDQWCVLQKVWDRDYTVKTETAGEAQPEQAPGETELEIPLALPNPRSSSYQPSAVSYQPSKEREKLIADN
jgi:lauroyl/myristoyl acyltransferase